MALPSTIYRTNIELADIDRGIYETLQTTVARHPSETEERLVAKLLASAIFFEPDLCFAKGVGAGDEPDLWLKGPDGRVLLWVEAGLPDADKLVKASRHAERAALFACGRLLPGWEQQQLPKLNKISNLTVISLEPEFINRLSSLLERSIVWSITITEGTLYLTVAGNTLETGITKVFGN